MKKFLEFTAIKIIPPRSYGLFHLSFFVLSILLSFLIANKLRNVSDRKNKKILFFIGIFLLVIEVYKELFYYFIVNNGNYDFSVFPFQLCDIPMYICLIIPFVKNKKVEEGMYNFMVSYNLLGAFVTFFEPSSLLRPYLLMMLHGFLWHGILMFLGIYIALSGRCLKNKKDFITSTKVYVILCSIALTLNVFLKNVTKGTMNAFYLGPSVSPVIIFRDISERFGWFANLLVFVSTMTFGAYLVYMFAYNLENKKSFSKDKILRRT